MSIRNPRGIGARRTDERAYEKALRKAYYLPFVRLMQRALAQAEAANQAYRAMDVAVQEMAARPQQGIPVELIQAELNRMEGWHRAKVISSFRTALGVDIRPFLTSPAVNAFMAQKVAENVSLVRTLPERFKDGLKKKLEDELREAPFDQERLTKFLREEYKVGGYNVRRLCRDQVSKLANQLSEIRHNQLGITSYVWRSAQDERTRPTHAANDGKTFEWANPPAETGPPGADVMCRCYAEGVVTRSKAQALGGSALTA